MRHIKFLLSILLASRSLLAEHTVYRAPVFMRGDFFDVPLNQGERIAVSGRLRYEQAINKQALGRYFGPDGMADFTFGPRYETELFTSLFIHGDSENEHQSVSLRPSVDVQKLDLSFFGQLLELTAQKHFGLFTNVSFARVVQQLGAVWQSRSAARTDLQSDYQDFFSGRPVINDFGNVPGGNSQQLPLAQAKFYDGAQSSTGPSSLTLGVVYDDELPFYGTIRLQGLACVPCSAPSDPSVLFKPVRGMGKHFGLGVSADVTAPLSSWVNVIIGCRDMYWIPTHEMRTPGIKFRPYGSYVALGTNGQVNVPVIPAANVLTQNCLVTPGHALSGRMVLEGDFVGGNKAFFSWQGMYKEAERVSLSASWPAATYAVVSPIFNTSRELTTAVRLPDTLNIKFDVGANSSDNVWLQQKDLDFNVCATPSFFEHYVELGWECFRSIKNGKANGGPRVVIGARLIQGENAVIVPSFFSLEAGYLIKF